MIKIKCCYTACRYNADNYCQFVGEIELGDYKCTGCGIEDYGMDCKTFEWKEELLIEEMYE